MRRPGVSPVFKAAATEPDGDFQDHLPPFAPSADDSPYLETPFSVPAAPSRTFAAWRRGQRQPGDGRHRCRFGLLGAGLAVAADAGQLQWFLLLPPWFLLRMALNAIDGLLAREFGQGSTLGAYLNELSDLVADAALYLPFALLSEAAAC
jgi:hypothetical protein